MELRLYLTCELLLLCVVNVVFGCRGLPPDQNIGSITGVSEIEVGSSVEIVCSLYTDHLAVNGTIYNVNSSHLFMRKAGGILENVTVLNESSVLWKLHHGQVNDTGVYQCFVKIPISETPVLYVCSMDMEVGYKPFPVTNFSCESIYFRNLTCQWSIPPNPVKTQYILRQNLGFLSFGCPSETTTASSCSWSLYTKPLYQQTGEKLDFVLIGRNSLGVEKQHFSLSHSKIVRPGPPRLNISVHKNNATLVFMRHSALEHITLRIILQYQLRFTVGNSSAFYEIFEYERAQMTLVPFQKYTFALRCKSKDAGDDMWGPFSEVKTLWTEPDVPYLAPVTSSSLFHSEVGENSRVVSVYWERVPSLNHNGPDFCYLISYYPCKNSVIKKEIEECQRNYLQIKNLAVNECYTFRICPTNALGISSNCSYVNVTEDSKLLPAVDSVTVVRGDKHFYSLSWDPVVSETPGIYNYTVLWCKTDIPSSLQCSGPVNWFYTKNNVVQLKGLDQDSVYSFAVSVNSDDFTSGINVATCLLQLNFSLHGALNKIPRVFLKEMSTTTIKVKWYSNICSPRNFRTLNVTYCEVQLPDDLCIGDIRYLNVTEPVPDGIVIKGLQPETNYRAVVSALTREGWHVESEPLYKSAYANDFGVVPMVLIIIASALICVGVICTLVTGARRLKQKIDQEKSTVIKLPEGLDHDVQYEHLTTSSVKKCVSSENPSFKSFQVVESGYFDDITPDVSLITKSSDGENKTDSCETSPQNSDFGLSAKNYCRPKSMSLPCAENPHYLKVTELILQGTSVDCLSPLAPNCAEHHPRSPYIGFDQLCKNSCEENVTSPSISQSSPDSKLYSNMDHYSRCGLKKNVIEDPVNVIKRSDSLGSLGLFKSQNPYISFSFAANLNVDPDRHNKMPCSNPDETAVPERSEESSCSFLPPVECPASSKFTSPYIAVSHLLESASKNMGDGFP